MIFAEVLKLQAVIKSINEHTLAPSTTRHFERHVTQKSGAFLLGKH